jgi:hypothetical protein
MKPLYIAMSAGLAVALATGAAQSLAEQKKAPAPPPPPASAQQQPQASDIEPAALDALRRMSAYLSTLTSFEITTENSLELVMDDGQKIDVDGANRYIVQRPDRFMIEVATDRKVRKLYYDGKSLTLSAPKLGYYTTVAAPPTIRQTLDTINDRYGVTVPLEDLFRWSDPNSNRSDKIQAAMVVGPATIGGVACDQYAFREGDLDWQIWITKGDKPTPRKVVIVDRKDSARPAFTARLNWNTSPQLASDAFTFRPSQGDRAIRIAAR